MVGVHSTGEKIMNSGIEVFFTKVNRPWSNADVNDRANYFVNVYGPDGAILIGVPVPATERSISIDLPPGRYLVTASINAVYVNFDSNETIVNVGCNQRVCVTIIPRSLHFCIYWLRAAFQIIAENPKLAPEMADIAKPALDVLNIAEQQVPQEFRQLPFLREAFESISQFSRRNQEDVEISS